MSSAVPPPPPRFSFRALERTDFPWLQKWLAAPHVAVWWNTRFDPASLEAHYGPRIDRQEPVFVFLIEQEGVPLGWIQWYRWRDFPEHAARLGAGANSAGLDLAIGELEWTGRGLGPAVLREFGEKFIFAEDGVEAIIADPAAENTRSVVAFLKAGFRIASTVRLPGEDFDRRVVRLDRSPLA